jgi:hypothetical protein
MLTEQSKSLESIRSPIKRRPNFDKIQSHASNVFSLLQKGVRASCGAGHLASLYLKPAQLDPGTKQALQQSHDDDVKVHIVLRHKSVSNTQLTTLWEAEIRLITNDDASVTSRRELANDTSKKGKRKIRFDDQTTLNQDPKATPARNNQQQDLDEIRDLCDSIDRLRIGQPGGTCFGYMLDTPTAARHGLFWPQNPLVDIASLDSVPLGTLLTSKRGKLSVADCRRIAVAVALGMLRLYKTPWLDEHWGRDDILLFKKDEKILIDRPFVTSELMKSSLAQRVATERYFASSPVIKNQTLFALGIVLIELCLKKPFDDLLAPEDLNSDGTKHIASDFVAANRILQQVYDTAGGRYGDVVRRCIHCDFDSRQSSLDDIFFRGAVYDKVVAVLEEDRDQFFNLY